MLLQTIIMTQAAMIMKQGRDLGIKSVFVSDDSCDTPDLLSLAGHAAEGCYFTNLTSLDDPTIKTWIANYTKEYGAVPILPNCVMAVDAMRAYVAAITQAKSAEPVKIYRAAGEAQERAGPHRDPHHRRRHAQSHQQTLRRGDREEWEDHLPEALRQGRIARPASDGPGPVRGPSGHQVVHP